MILKNKLLLIIALCNLSTIFGQQIITTSLTEGHKEIRGSKVSMIPPNDFTVATNFMGFQQEDTNSSIMVLDFPTSYTTVIKGFTKENFEKAGLKMEAVDTLTLNNKPAILVRGVQFIYEQNYTKYILVFGSETETIMINGASVMDKPLLSTSIKNAMLTVVYDPNKVLSPLDAVDFRLETKNTGYVFSKSMSNMLIYDKELLASDESSDKRSFVVSKSISKSNVENKKLFAENRIKGLPMQVNQILTVAKVFINNLEGYEIIADGVNRKTGQKEQAFLTILFNDLDYYILYGSSVKDFDQNSASFRKLAQTFELK